MLNMMIVEDHYRDQVELLKQAHADDDVVTALKHEVLCESQGRAWDGRRYEEMIAIANERVRASKHQTNLLGRRLRQVSEMHEVTMAE
eukprot:140934-Amphidinium_carterae.1